MFFMRDCIVRAHTRSVHTHTRIAIAHITLRYVCVSVTYAHTIAKTTTETKIEQQRKKSSHITQTPACSSVSADGCFICWLPCVVFNHQLWWLSILCHFLLAWICLHLGTLYSLFARASSSAVYFVPSPTSCEICVYVCVRVSAPNQWQWQR